MRTYIILLFLFSLSIQAQDVHYSQFDKTKSLINPSLIAMQNDNYEIQLQRRSQWSSVTVPFNTFSLSFNAKEVYKNFSFGASVLNDVAGDSYFSIDGLSLSFVKAFNLEDNLFSIALQTAIYQRSVNYDNLIFMDNEVLQNVSFPFFDIGFGISSYRSLDAHSSLLVGFSSYHLNKPNLSLIADNLVFLNTKYILHSTYRHSLSSKIDITPTTYFSSQGFDKEFIIGSGILFKFNDDINFMSGLYARAKDAIFLTLGLQKDNVELLISYDINTSKLSNASNYMGAFEFSLSYGWSILNEKNISKSKICPKYL